jgi:hypothetical protein
MHYIYIYIYIYINIEIKFDYNSKYIAQVIYNKKFPLLKI